MLEIFNWVMVVVILGGLVALGVLFAGPREWLSAVVGFAGFDLAGRAFRFVPEGVDWFLIGAFAAYSGCGGAVNLTLTNWVRDKGYGMGQVVGFIPALVGGQKVTCPRRGASSSRRPASSGGGRAGGASCASTSGRLLRGALLGMALPGILYTAAIPAAPTCAAGDRLGARPRPRAGERAALALVLAS